VIKNTGICATMSAPAADGFLDFLNWLLQMKKSHRHLASGSMLMLSVNPLRFPTFQNIIVLDQEFRNQRAQEIRHFVAQPGLSEYFLPIEIDHISRFANYIETVETPHNETHIEHASAAFNKTDTQQTDIDNLKRDFKSFFNQYDVRRNKNFV
jgi:hypothetical protein